MTTSDFSTNSAGTKDWLRATAKLTIRSYNETPRAGNTETLSTRDFGDTLKRAIKAAGPTVPMSET